MNRKFGGFDWIRFSFSIILFINTEILGTEKTDPFKEVRLFIENQKDGDKETFKKAAREFIEKVYDRDEIVLQGKRVSRKDYLNSFSESDDSAATSLSVQKQGFEWFFSIFSRKTTTRNKQHKFFYLLSKACLQYLDGNNKNQILNELNLNHTENTSNNATLISSGISTKDSQTETKLTAKEK